MASTEPNNVGGTPRKLNVEGIYLREKPPSPIKQPHVCKHKVLDVIALDPTRRQPPKICDY